LLHASWWIGSPGMFWVILLGGLVVVRKIRRFTMVVTFVLTALAVMLLTAPAGGDMLQVVRNAFLSWPLLFLATIMLTEPATSPPTRYYQVLYALLIGVLFSAPLHIGSLYSTPEAALIIGNIFAYIVSPKYNLRLKLVKKVQLSPSIYEYIFSSNHPLAHTAGQYMEWTLPPTAIDSRGNRRTFTIASSPTEPEVRIGVRFYEPSSKYKQLLHKLEPGNDVIAGHIAGDFVVPTDAKQKLVFIAGGIGITPFRSMIKYLIDIKQQRDIVLFYSVNEMRDAVYKDLLTTAEAIGINTHYVVAHGKATKDVSAYQGYLTAELLQKTVPDYKDRLFYLSGPPSMVNSYKKLLKQQGIARNRIKTDYFAGY
jgi:ferredoxin-NADP reductase